MQMFPQAPQLLGSCEVSVHTGSTPESAPPHRVLKFGHEQIPTRQSTAGCVQMLPQPPQLEVSENSSTHTEPVAPVQALNEGPREQPHTPPLHSAPGPAHVNPQLPQF
jgi:hypothetical protein